MRCLCTHRSGSYNLFLCTLGPQDCPVQPSRCSLEYDSEHASNSRTHSHVFPAQLALLLKETEKASVASAASFPARRLSSTLSTGSMTPSGKQAPVGIAVLKDRKVSVCVLLPHCFGAMKKIFSPYLLTAWSELSQWFAALVRARGLWYSQHSL